jgi:hypothetical protein
MIVGVAPHRGKLMFNVASARGTPPHKKLAACGVARKDSTLATAAHLPRFRHLKEAAHER